MFLMHLNVEHVGIGLAGRATLWLSLLPMSSMRRKSRRAGVVHALLVT